MRGETIKERQPGYYWIRYLGQDPEVAEYTWDFHDRWVWIRCGIEHWVSQLDDVIVLSERLTPPA